MLITVQSFFIEIILGYSSTEKLQIILITSQVH